MQTLMNKKNLNRIQRRDAKLVQSEHSDHEKVSMVSAFRAIDYQKNSILRTIKLEDRISFKLDKFLSFCHKVQPKKNPFDELSRPKATSCQKIDHHSFRETRTKQKYFDSNKKSKRLKQLNKTISFSFNQTIKTNTNSNQKIFKVQDEIDLKNEEFKRRHQSFKNYETFLVKQTAGMQKNTITGNILNKQSIEQIYERNKTQEEKKNLMIQMYKTSQQASNQQRQNDELRQLCSFDLRFDNISQKLPQTMKIRDIFDRKTTEKYQRLFDSIRNSEKYCIESYDDYDKALTQKSPILKRIRPQRNKVLVNYAEEWR